MMSLRCRTCNTAFHDNGSLEVHYQYTHGETAEGAPPEKPPDADSTESNNNFFKFQENMTAISPGADREFSQNREQPSYDMNQSYNEYIIPDEYPRLPSSVANSAYFPTDQRYHPYYKPGFRDVRIQQPPMPMFRCNKCDFMCIAQEAMLHHYNVAHGTIPALGIHGSFNPRFGPPVNGNEPQAEILDLDSHKVHVYQPPNGEDSQPENVEQWLHSEKKYNPHQQLQVPPQNQNGSRGTPVPSPEFGNVSTTTDNIENLQSSVMSPYNQYENPPANNTSAQITSTDTPPRSSSKQSKSSNGSWKSNEARRPKTYNCSACNKWFTSSGHLKRHYNTTLHKNAVKQSGIPDPALMPVSAHHHPHKEAAYPPSSRQKPSPPVSEPPPEPPIRTQPINSFLHSSPNLMAGPSVDIPGGLMQPPFPKGASPPPTNHSNYMQYSQPHFFQQPTSTPLYPNFQSPHVSTILPVTMINPIGNPDSDEKLPGFAFIQSNGQNIEQFLNTLLHGNVGGSGMQVRLDADLIKQELEEAVDDYALDSPDDGSICQQLSPVACKPDFEVVTSTQSPERNPLKPNFTCVDCNKNFNKSCYLTQHNKTFHNGEKPFKCERCGKRFPDAIKFKTHSAKHNGDKPYKCDRCPKQFNHKTDLRRHACLHTNVRPYACDLCAKGFIRKDHMLKHRDTHHRKPNSKLKMVRLDSIKVEDIENINFEMFC